jgi:hypothetical protein
MEKSEFQRYVRDAFGQMDDGVKHPSTQQIAEIASKTSGATCAEVQRHVLTCDQCQQLLQEFEQFQTDCECRSAQNVDDEWREFRRGIRWHRPVMTKPRWGTIAATIIVGCGLAWFSVKVLAPKGRLRTIPERAVATNKGGAQGGGAVLISSDTQGSSSPVGHVAQDAQRTIEFRLPDREYAPLQPEQVGDSVVSLSEPLLKERVRLAQEINAHPNDPEVLRLQGESEMMARHAAAAVQILQKALNFRPQDTRILTDLGVAYALRGDIEGQYCAHIQLGRSVSNACAHLEGQPSDYSKALEYLKRSVDLHATRSAIFNRALVLERISRNTEAALEWKSYLDLDSTSSWATEARHRPRGDLQFAGQPSDEDRHNVLPVPHYRLGGRGAASDER